ncbi:MAG: acetolactate synthase small subunit [Candidatus Aureabacteria bacterium]|nr:acetolactate synthase small subunit [Candidatus Auribacterota bacterium]
MQNHHPVKHTISLLVNNKPGVLVRIAQVFARRGFNIDSLVVSPTTDDRFSSMTIVSTGSASTLDQIIKQVCKLIDVVHGQEHNPSDSISRELALFKVKCPLEKRTEILQIVEHFRAQTIDFTEDSLVIQSTGSSEKLDAMTQLLKNYDLMEMIRTGKIVITRGDQTT